ncbi:MAG: DNA methyltransferase [Planctomycetota bacterium]
MTDPDPRHRIAPAGWLFDLAEPAQEARPQSGLSVAALLEEVRHLRSTGIQTVETTTRASDGSVAVPVFTNTFWSTRQRDGNALHEVSYRACFKPALPRFFIERLCPPGGRVHDPFLGRGTTALEAALLGRIPSGADANPLSRVLLEPRLTPPTATAVAARLAELDLDVDAEVLEDLDVFFHPRTLRAIAALRAHFLHAEASGSLDAVDRWLRMVTVNRLTGHSPGFLSVYTMPPNQAVSIATQRKLNVRRAQTPPERDLREIVLRKSRSLLAGCDESVRSRLAAVADHARFVTGSSARRPELEDGSVDLVVTSPPFLDIVQYRADNWLRCWFCGIDPDAAAIAELRRIEAWMELMTAVLQDLRRMLKPTGVIAFEVGEVRGGTVRLEEQVLACGVRAGLVPHAVLVQDHAFTKTANCWGVSNNARGTNTNRVVLLGR